MGGLSSENVCRFQTLLMKAQMNFEDYFNDLAILNNKPAVILMDRGNFWVRLESKLKLMEF